MKQNNLLYIVFDSCRYDSFVAAKLKHIAKLGQTSRRFAFASWTIPSHCVYLMGASPHKNPRGVFASEVYKKDFVSWSDRLGIAGISFKDFVPQLSVPAFLREKGYKTNALVSMPVLNQLTIVNRHFDRFELMENYNDFSSIIDKLKFSDTQPSYYLINVGETHYPYTRVGEDAGDLLHGPNGVMRHQGDAAMQDLDSMPASEIYNLDNLQSLHNKQIANVEYLDSLFDKLYQVTPPNTHIIVTADHGECFGEDGYFGHGPVFHEKVFDIPFVEGLRP